MRSGSKWKWRGVGRVPGTISCMSAAEHAVQGRYLSETVEGSGAEPGLGGNAGCCQGTEMEPSVPFHPRPWGALKTLSEE